jgi:TPR repeat protein
LLFAAENNHVLAQHILGIILIRGDLGMDKQHQSLYWLGVAASERHKLSAIIMRHFYEYGKYGIKQDPCLARDWYELCLTLGVQEANNFIHVIDSRHTCN